MFIMLQHFQEVTGDTYFGVASINVNIVHTLNQIFYDTYCNR